MNWEFYLIDLIKRKGKKVKIHGRPVNVDFL